MTNNESLARRWMASKHWGGWRAGMRCAQTLQVIICGPDPDHIWSQGFRIPDEGASPQPDLDHPGTRAFLLEDVRRALGFNAPYHEAEALIAALEAAPE